MPSSNGKLSLQPCGISDLSIIHMAYRVMSILSVPFTEKQYKKLLKALAELIDEVGNNEKYPLAQLIETIGNLIEKYENDQFAITQYVM